MDKRWFVKQRGKGCLDHKHHLHLPPDFVHLPKKCLDPSVLENIRSMSSIFLPSNVMKAMLDAKNKYSLRRDQIRYLRRSYMLGFLDDGSGLTIGQKIMKLAKEHDEMVCYPLIVEKTRLGLFTCKRKRVRRTRRGAGK
jgi:hypothetical protein